MRVPMALCVVVASVLLPTVGMAAGKADTPNDKRVLAREPKAVLRQLEKAYETKSVEAYAALLAADYRFHTSDTALVRYLKGIDRQHELEYANNLFNGTMVDGKVVRKAAKQITLTVGDLTEGPDPEHPDSTEQYRAVVAGQLEFKVVQVDKKPMYALPAQHVFHMVRGDAAVLLPGQIASPNRWYIRRWLEDVSGIALQLGTQAGGCGESAPALSKDAAPLTPGAGVLGVRALTNPACPALQVMCDVPGTEPVHIEVFDVTGRLANQREIEVASPGMLRVEAGAGARLVPGVYWVRLRQGRLRPDTKMVVVAH